MASAQGRAARGLQGEGKYTSFSPNSNIKIDKGDKRNPQLSKARTKKNSFYNTIRIVYYSSTTNGKKHHIKRFILVRKK